MVLTRILILIAALIGAAPSVADDDLTPRSQVDHWAFAPLNRPAVPTVSQSDWVRGAIDAFILARLERAGLAPGQSADRAALLRRACYDLVGLPPSRAEVESFLADDSPDAFEKVIDQLLDSPHYGEKWGRHWLDLVRYAETNSYERDGVKPHVWRYRDYVVHSLNTDKPYDQFIREQLAGDELDEVNSETLIATGFYRLGIWQDEPVDRDQEMFEDLDDIARTTSEVFLGQTIGCARCHDHKLDPISQRDYYRYVAFFRNVRRYGVRDDETVRDSSVRETTSPATEEAQRLALEQNKAQLADLQERMRKIESKVSGRFTGVEKDDFKYESNRLEILKRYIGKGLNADNLSLYEGLLGQHKELLDKSPTGNIRVLCVKEFGRQAPPTYVLARGNVHAPGEQVEPGFPAVLGFPDPECRPPSHNVESSGRRKALAEWIAHPANPLTARVMANRIWQYHFGRGIVRSSNNFGQAGTPPTHPQLLDWLASDFMDGGWQLKRMHKQIMLSAVYRMASAADPAGLEQDPENDLFWRFNMRRLAAEEIRDSILAVTGSLNRSQYGPSVYPAIADEVKAGQSRPGHGWEESSSEQQSRRSIYVHIKRSLILPMFATFDGPDVDASCPVRFVTTQPTQSLSMLNGEFLNQQAAILADYLRQHVGRSPRECVTTALWQVLQRPPGNDEVDRGVHLLETLQHDYQVDADQVLDYFCLMVLNLNEFIYLD